MVRTLAFVVFASALSASGAHAFECSSEEVGYFATFKVEEGNEERFESLVIDLTDKVRALEPGAVFYAPYRGEEPGVYHFMERYEDEAARRDHAGADEIRAIFGQIMPLLREPLEVTRISALCP